MTFLLYLFSEKKWCELWFEISENCNKPEDISKKLGSLDITFREKFILFPEKVVFLCKVNKDDLQKVINSIDYICEIHLFKEPASFFTQENSIFEQKQWEDDLLCRVKDSEQRIKVCILDTGVANRHPLLKDVIDEEDVLVENPQRIKQDIDGHGTQMAGLCEYFDLQAALESKGTIKRKVQLESVKILQLKNSNENPNEPDLYGLITENAVNMAQATHASDNRVHCMAITEETPITATGEPSSWSAYLDNLITGKDDERKKLFVVSAGNSSKSNLIGLTYPEGTIKNSVQSPAQAWNALTVGAYSSKTVIKDHRLSNYSPVAPRGELCPFSTTSLNWNDKWPIKPEVLFDGGNAIAGEFDSCDDLSLLTTSHQPILKPFATINATSSATAQASNVAAEIYSLYPTLWPETVRALIVHSAQWPTTVLERYKNLNKSERRKLLRCYGYGIGNKIRALNSFSNHAVMIIEDYIQPFKKQTGKGITFGSMNLHKLPWPKDFLIDLGTTPIRLKVTLSYFVEAEPEERGWGSKYRYQSAGLCFDIQHPAESYEEFIKRINKVKREDDYNRKNASKNNNWFLGEQRNVGSIHSDYWSGTASELSDCESLAVYPITGWWKTRTRLGKYNSIMRYSLIISLETDDSNVDIYNAIKTVIETQIKTQITTQI